MDVAGGRPEEPELGCWRHWSELDKAKQSQLDQTTFDQAQEYTTQPHPRFTESIQVRGLFLPMIDADFDAHYRNQRMHNRKLSSTKKISNPNAQNMRGTLYGNAFRQPSWLLEPYPPNIFTK